MSDATDAPTDETPKPTPPPSAPNRDKGTDPTQLPDDHPLVTAYERQKDEIKALKARAAKLDEIEEAQKSDAERAADALKAAQSEAAQAKAELLRYKVAADHGITDADDISLFLTGTDEETLTKQAERLAERSSSSSPRAPRPDPNQGRQANGPRSTADAFGAWAESQFTR